jgi:hypothetical protein
MNERECGCLLTDPSVQPNTGKYTLARFSKDTKENREKKREIETDERTPH